MTHREPRSEYGEHRIHAERNRATVGKRTGTEHDDVLEEIRRAARIQPRDRARRERADDPAESDSARNGPYDVDCKPLDPRYWNVVRADETQTEGHRRKTQPCVDPALRGERKPSELVLAGNRHMHVRCQHRIGGREDAREQQRLNEAEVEENVRGAGDQSDGREQCDGGETRWCTPRAPLQRRRASATPRTATKARAQPLRSIR